MNPDTHIPSAHPAWKVWSNPIFLRYCQSRLRPRGLGVSVLITVLITAFVFFMFRTTALYQAHLSMADAERSPLIALLIIQSIILFIFGTAQSAGGMTGERDEGVIDYQRLIPMSPLSKVLGYLFGLPVREYVMFLATLPFTIWSLWRGNVAMETWLPLYAVFFTSTLLYHLTGLVTGTVVKNRRWAFLASIGLVLCLYTIVPQMAKFGLVFFKYLTITPVAEESLPGLLPRNMGATMEVISRLAPTVKFFNLDFSEAIFTAFSQGGLILTFVIMLCRKWQRHESHLLGKLWATLFFLWIQVLLLGNALPLVDTGHLFISRGISRYIRIRGDWAPQSWEAAAMSGVYGLVTLVILFTLAGIITPSLDNQVRGWRRARKQGESSLGFLSDAATGFWFTLVMALAGAAGWSIFTSALVESRWFPGHTITPGTFAYFTAVMIAAGMGFQVLLELKGGRFLMLAAIFVGVVPVMAGSVLSSVNGQMMAIGTWLGGISPLTLPVYASQSLLTLAVLPPQIARSVPSAFQFWLLVSLIVTLWLAVKLRAARKAMAASVLGGGKVDDSGVPAGEVP